MERKSNKALRYQIAAKSTRIAELLKVLGYTGAFLVYISQSTTALSERTVLTKAEIAA